MDSWEQVSVKFKSEFFIFSQENHLKMSSSKLAAILSGGGGGGGGGVKNGVLENALW